MNLSNCILETSSKAKDHILARVVKEGLEEKPEGDHKDSELQLSQIHGKPLQITVGKTNKSLSSTNSFTLPVDDLLKMKANMNLSDRGVIKMAASIRASTKSRKAIEPGLKSKLNAKAHSIDEYFGFKEFPLVHIKGDEVSNAAAFVIFCKDIPGFVKHVRNERDVSDVHLKLGIDGGGGFLKICLSIQSTDFDSEHSGKRAKYDKGVAAHDFKDTGVKRLFILAAVANSQENYSNVDQLFSALNISPFDGTLATDLKLANILVGIMSHSSAHPCTYCYANKDELSICGELRSSENVLSNYKKWLTEGKGCKNKAKDYFNCIHPPLITSTEGTTFLDIIPPPELHLLLGVVNTVFTHMLKECENEALAWANDCHVQREIRRGGSGFKGNACKTLLDKVDLLRRSANLAVLKYVQVFDDFKKVVSSCFGNNLSKNYKAHIAAFRKSYTDLGVSITPKVHIVFFHVQEFCDKNGLGLGFFGEQAMESVHYDFLKSSWEMNKVAANHQDYPKKLLRAVCSYNALHV